MERQHFHTWQRTPSFSTKCPPLAPVQKQVQFNMGDDLGESPSLPLGLVHFLGENAADEQNDTPQPSVPCTNGSTQPPHNNSHLHHPIHTRGFSPKAADNPTATILAAPQPSRMPNPVDQADDWLQAQIRQAGRHPWWCKELQALYEDHPVHNLCGIHTLEYS